MGWISDIFEDSVCCKLGIYLASSFAIAFLEKKIQFSAHNFIENAGNCKKRENIYIYIPVTNY